MKLGCRRKCYHRFIVKAVAVVAGFSKENTIRDCETLILMRGFVCSSTTCRVGDDPDGWDLLGPSVHPRQQLGRDAEHEVGDQSGGSYHQQQQWCLGLTGL